MTCGAGYSSCLCLSEGRPCQLQKCVDDAFWTLLAGLHDIDEGHPTLTHEDVIKAALKELSKMQFGVG